ncbi:hypothetical protein PUN28_002870 [Cardiocondyla obscurior]|uniref:Uncharacterized protein n=1 Tax=Cardiocondyla obscurior TaxID=286306 RepID=A0AAW2GWH4_9HYME
MTTVCEMITCVSQTRENILRECWRVSNWLNSAVFPTSSTIRTHCAVKLHPLFAAPLSCIPLLPHLSLTPLFHYSFFRSPPFQRFSTTRDFLPNIVCHSMREEANILCIKLALQVTGSSGYHVYDYTCEDIKHKNFILYI